MSSIQPLISVIIPIYNREKYLCAAIDSILAQTYTNWELILVDDGSTDASAAICDQYVQRDARIHAYHKENGGVSSARNVGMQHARGEWLYFLDSDDWIEPIAFETLLSHSDGADIVMGNYPVPSYNVWKVAEDITVIDLDKMTQTELSDLYFFRVFYTVWDKLYARKSISAKFDESLDYFEDTCFNLSQFHDWKRIVVLPDDLYHYRLGHQSLTGWVRFDRIVQCQRIFDGFYDIFGQCAEALAHFSRQYVLRVMTYCCVYLCDHNRPEFERRLCLGLWLEDESFDNSRVSTELLHPNEMEFWQHVLQRNSEEILRLFEVKDQPTPE